MKIEIVSGQEHANIESFFDNLLTENRVIAEDKTCYVMRYPEHKIAHQTATLNYVRSIVAKYIKEKKDLYILTYSDHVLNGVRLEVKKHGFSGAVCHQIMDDGEDICADIDDEGHLSVWADGVFDTWENALTELLTKG